MVTYKTEIFEMVNGVIGLVDISLHDKMSGGQYFAFRVRYNEDKDTRTTQVQLSDKGKDIRMIQVQFHIDEKYLQQVRDLESVIYHHQNRSGVKRTFEELSETSIDLPSMPCNKMIVSQ